jgi:hypothetical protein
LASYSPGEDCAYVTLSNYEAFEQILDFRNEYCVELPLHGAANEVLARPGTQEYRFCIVLRNPSATPREQSADRASIAELEGRFGPSAFFDIEMDGTNKDDLLKAAAYALAYGQLSEDIKDDAKRLGTRF